ncbi:DUF948 domain-containing protein [Spirulina sp. CS-785/01]|uniref:DUF948 domain-containing protein n=1 Tax=Spirulina sp. CS-785/01 TaxID=3021716 RepID=UPI00232E975F|nr:DUF948 domain-containing protein [Spirulina sp. CS-785/01]MDB9315387.1 DUF948 domain-containing protein [Spirulina sp. CS-785/01]
MIDPLFWLGLSLFLVAISLTAVLIAALPAFRELARASRSAEKLFDTLRREFPPTLEAIRLTGLEISELTDDISEGVNHASDVVKQVDDGVESVRQQGRRVQVGTRSVVAGVKAAWASLQKPKGKAAPPPSRPLYRSRERDRERLPPSFTELSDYDPANTPVSESQSNSRNNASKS